MAESSDLAAQRAERIRQVLRERGVARVGDLCRELRVSAATVRRDLAALDRGGQVRRVHGGAMIADLSPEEPLFDDKAAIAAEEKRRIAEAARRLIGPEDTIFLDGGSTVLALARLVATLNRALPKIRIEYPKDSEGKLVPRALSADQLREHTGLLGHYHVQRGKVDPGPAFNWDWVVREAGRLKR